MTVVLNDVECLWGIDSSYDELTLDEARTFKEQGVDVFGQCLWTGDPTNTPESRERSVAAALAAGGYVVGYISVAKGFTGADHVKMALAEFSPSLLAQISWLPIDVELPGLLMGVHVLPALDELARRGKAPAIYTSRGQWASMGNPLRPEGCKLWDASWGISPETGLAYKLYGGWAPTEVMGRQFASPSVPQEGGGDLHGQDADRDIFRASDFIVPPPPAPEDYVVHMQQMFKSGKVWEMDVVPPPGVQS